MCFYSWICGPNLHDIPAYEGRYQISDRRTKLAQKDKITTLSLARQFSALRSTEKSTLSGITISFATLINPYVKLDLAEDRRKKELEDLKD
jgi:hypothetical protein